MVIGAHTATKGKSLVDSIVPYKEVVLCRLLRVVVIGIVGKTCHHLLKVIPRHLALLAIKLVGSNNRRTRKTLARRAYIGSLECAVSLVHPLFRSIVYVESLG